MAEEGLRQTDNKLIHIGNPIRFDHDRFLVDLQALMNAADSNSDNIRALLMRAVPTFRPAANEPHTTTTGSQQAAV